MHIPKVCKTNNLVNDSGQMTIPLQKKPQCPSNLSPFSITCQKDTELTHTIHRSQSTLDESLHGEGPKNTTEGGKIILALLSPLKTEATARISENMVAILTMHLLPIKRSQSPLVAIRFLVL